MATQQTSAAVEIRRAAEGLRKQKHYKIIIGDGDDISPQGVVVGVNGYIFRMRPGKEVSVPRAVLEVLDHSIASAPYKNPDTGQIVGWHDVKRFPYTIVGDSLADHEAAR